MTALRAGLNGHSSRRPAQASGLLAVLCLAAGIALALWHPLAPAAAAIAVGWIAILVAWRPGTWAVVVPAALPVLNFAPWSGGVAVEEFDLLLLAVAAGGWWRRAVAAPAPSPEPERRRSSWRRAFVVCAAVFAACSLIAFVRAVVGSWDGAPLTWFDGETAPLNAWRVVKSVVGVALLWPLLRDRLRVEPRATARGLAVGMLVGIAIVDAAVLWERLAYPGLLEFSGPYRAVGFFWEMHVGGAAIDAYLALATPFVAGAVWSARSPGRWAAAALLSLLTAHAALTTFSRGLYAAVALPLVVLGVVFVVRHRHGPVAARLGRAALIGGALFGAAVALAALLDAGDAVGIGLLLLGLGVVAWRVGRGVGAGTWRRLAAPALALALLLEVVTVLGIGSFMRQRLAASEDDLGSRVAHWRAALGLASTPADVLFGIGVGRLPAAYAARVPRGELPGDVRFVAGPDGNGSVRLLGPKTRTDLRGLTALTQRVGLRPGALHRATFDLRVERPANLLLRVCETHLLYTRACQRTLLRAVPTGAGWQRVSVDLRGAALSAGSSAWPRRAAFSMAVLNAGGAVEIDRVELRDAAGASLLTNGDFAAGLAHWWPVVRSHFLPWHIDNLFLEVAIERGLPAALALVAALALAIGSGLRRGAGRVAPFIAAALLGGVCVGLVSSVMDAPRVAFLMLFLAVAVVEIAGRGTPGASPASPQTRGVERAERAV